MGHEAGRGVGIGIGGAVQCSTVPADPAGMTLGVLSFCHTASWKAASALTYELWGPMSRPALSKDRDTLLDTPEGRQEEREEGVRR